MMSSYDIFMLDLELKRNLLRKYSQENARYKWKESKNPKNLFKIQQA